MELYASHKGGVVSCHQWWFVSWDYADALDSAVTIGTEDDLDEKDVGKSYMAQQ